jgi:hypothetical protein
LRKYATVPNLKEIDSGVQTILRLLSQQFESFNVSIIDGRDL